MLSEKLFSCILKKCILWKKKAVEIKQDSGESWQILHRNRICCTWKFADTFYLVFHMHTILIDCSNFCGTQQGRTTAILLCCYGKFLATVILPHMPFFLLLILALTLVLCLIFFQHPLKQRFKTPRNRKTDEALNYSPIPLYTLWTREAWQFTEGVRQVRFEVH